jgi:hypothetical protein
MIHNNMLIGASFWRRKEGRKEEEKKNILSSKLLSGTARRTKGCGCCYTASAHPIGTSPTATIPITPPLCNRNGNPTTTSAAAAAPTLTTPAHIPTTTT